MRPMRGTHGDLALACRAPDLWVWTAKVDGARATYDGVRVLTRHGDPLTLSEPLRAELARAWSLASRIAPGVEALDLELLDGRAWILDVVCDGDASARAALIGSIAIGDRVRAVPMAHGADRCAAYLERALAGDLGVSCDGIVLRDASSKYSWGTNGSETAHWIKIKTRRGLR